MRIKRRLIFVLLLFLFISSACHRKQGQGQENAAQKALVKKLDKLVYDYTWFSGKAQASFSSGLMNQDFTLHLRMKKGEVIWLTLNGPLNIEGARLYLTPDTLRAMDRLKGQFYESSFTALRDKYNIPLSFQQVQDVLSGAVLKASDLKQNIQETEDNILITSISPELESTFFVHPKNYTLDKLRLKDRREQRELLIKFASYSEINGRPFANSRMIEVNLPHEKTSLDLDFQKASFDEPQEFPYTVSERYSIAHF
jgi:hypothetical protein